MDFSIQACGLSKKYNKEWIFKDLNYSFHSGKGYVLLGNNGSGKSTLLQVLSGNIAASRGNVIYKSSAGILPQDQTYKSISIASPYLELIEEFTFPELIQYQQTFKPFLTGLGTSEILELSLLKKEKDKLIKFYSSGMKQRAKLSLAILSAAPVLLLDEPTSNLDHGIIEWYRNLVIEFAADKLKIVCSNHQKDEYFFAEESIEIADYKPASK